MKKTRVLTGVMLFFAVAMMLGGCGVSHKSPEAVAKSLITAYEKGKLSQALECFGVEDDDKETTAIAQANIDYYEGMKSKGVNVESSEVIQDFKNYVYMYIYYTVEVGDDKAYPRLETFFVTAKDNDYYIMPAKDITSEMTQEAESAYIAFMQKDAYKEYQKAYDSFVVKNPQFEENLANKLK